MIAIKRTLSTLFLLSSSPLLLLLRAQHIQIVPLVDAKNRELLRVADDFLLPFACKQGGGREVLGHHDDGKRGVQFWSELHRKKVNVTRGFNLMQRILDFQIFVQFLHKGDIVVHLLLKSAVFVFGR